MNHLASLPKAPDGRNQPRRTALRRGVYTAVMRGPQGVILDFGMDIAERAPFQGALDDDFLQELLVINSVIGGWIEGELHNAQRTRGGSAA